jgi:hypothetical protein
VLKSTPLLSFHAVAFDQFPRSACRELSTILPDLIDDAQVLFDLCENRPEHAKPEVAAWETTCGFQRLPPAVLARMNIPGTSVAAKSFYASKNTMAKPRLDKLPADTILICAECNRISRCFVGEFEKPDRRLTQLARDLIEMKKANEQVVEIMERIITAIRKRIYCAEGNGEKLGGNGKPEKDGVGETDVDLGGDVDLEVGLGSWAMKMWL